MWAPPVAAGQVSLLGVPALSSALGLGLVLQDYTGLAPWAPEEEPELVPKKVLPGSSTGEGLLSWRAEPLGVAGPVP